MENPSGTANQRFVVGIIRSSHGLTGKFKVESTSGECAHFAQFTEVTLRSGTCEKQFKVESVEGTVTHLLMKCKGIDSPEEVAKYRNWEILVPRDMACPLEEGEFYIADLEQCTLIYSDKNGRAAETAPIVIGTITSVLEGGAGYLLEISLSESYAEQCGIKPTTKLVPFKEQFIGEVNIAQKTVQLMHLWILE